MSKLRIAHLALAALCGMAPTGAARAAPVFNNGCADVNAGAFNQSASGLDDLWFPVRGFQAGDVINFTIAHTYYQFTDGANFELLSDVAPKIVYLDSSSPSPKPPNGTTLIETLSYTVTGSPDDADLAVALWSGGDDISVTATCTPAGQQQTNTDSQKLRAVQVSGSKVVAQTSGGAISGAIDGAIGDALSGGNSGGTGGGGQQANLGGPLSTGIASRRGGMPAPYALGLGEQTQSMPGFASKSPWRPWASVRGSGWDEETSSAKLHGTQINATFGLSYLVNPGFVVGVLGGYETFGYEVKALDGKLDGDGWSIGAYAGWKVLPGLRLDAAVVHSSIGYDASAGTASGTFDGRRWLVAGGATGTLPIGVFVLEPSARINALFESQGAYVDSLGTAQDARGFSAGRASLGGKVSYPLALGGGATLTPYAGLFADYHFASDDAVPAGQPEFGIADGYSARAVSGVTVGLGSGARLGVDGEYGGIGSGDSSMWSVTGRGSLPF